ncbi:MAG TPA: RDD family protein [Micromonosporaceae bacterium]|nr:RDD family protein [Micromonosporaceae bacterium]
MANPTPAATVEYVAQAASTGAHGGGNDPTESDPGVQQPVPLGRRFSALLIDWLLCLFASAPLGGLRDNPWAAPAALVVEYGFFLGLFGQTPGMYLARIRCVGYATGGPIGIPRAILRGLLLTLFVPPLIMDREQRGLHDRASGSVIVSSR